jgi:hypothetical protein
MKLKTFTKAKMLVLLLSVITFSTKAQNINPNIQSHSNYAAISTAFPFLRLTVDARTASMGEAGVAAVPNVNALSINPSTLVFMPHSSGLAVSYNPWLSSIARDMYLSYLSAYINSGSNAVGASFKYFSIGDVNYTNENASTIGVLHPVEYAVDLSFARKFGNTFSMATSVRYVQSRLTLDEQATALRASTAGVAVDISAYMVKRQFVFDHEGTISAGINISNIGAATINESTGTTNFLPTNLRIGVGLSNELDDLSQLSFALDLNKLLVPIVGDTFPGTIWKSFTDAPRGLKEELAEISVSAGIEYLFKQQFALRTGYMYEHPEKGNRRYVSFGVGLRFDSWNVDLAYIPAKLEKNPMANALKVSLMFNFGRLQSNHWKR